MQATPGLCPAPTCTFLSTWRPPSPTAWTTAATLPTTPPSTAWVSAPTAAKQFFVITSWARPSPHMYPVLMVTWEKGGHLVWGAAVATGDGAMLATVPSIAEYAVAACAEHSSPCRCGLCSPSRQINDCNGRGQGPSGVAACRCLPLAPFPRVLLFSLRRNG
jgi:hypothetical protein